MNLIKYLVLIFLLALQSGRQLSDIKWHGTLETTNPYAAILELQNSDDLIIIYGTSSVWSLGKQSECLVFSDDESVQSYTLERSHQTDSVTGITHNPISEMVASDYRKALYEIVEREFDMIDPSKLNIDRKRSPDENSILYKQITDGVTYKFEVFQGRKYIRYSTYSPEDYIEDDYPGSAERQQLLELFRIFDSIENE